MNPNYCANYELARIIDALEAKVGPDYLLALTADHGMPSAQP